MSEQTPFELSVVYALKSPTVRSKVQSGADILRKPETAISSNFEYRFSVQEAGNTDQLFKILGGTLGSVSQRRTIIVSDDLAIRSNGSCQPTELAGQIRDLFRSHPDHLCGLVAIVDGSSRRTTDIDCVVDGEAIDPPRLKQAEVRVADGLWLKSRIDRESGRIANKAVRVHLVRNEKEMRDSLAIRHRVYGAMGYLDEELAASESQIEVDEYDKSSLHFAATDHETGNVVGTMRLVFASVGPFLLNTVAARPAKTVDSQAELCRGIVRSTGNPMLARRLNLPLPVPFPILRNSDFLAKRPEFDRMLKCRGGAELSRLVVSPEYRRLGVGKLLVRAGIAAAVSLRKQFIVLECIPSHQGMYEQFGFSAIAGHRCRTRGLDQVAVGMTLLIDRDPNNEAVSLARRDIQMISSPPRDSKMMMGKKCLCLCHIEGCWDRGEYSYRGKLQCPRRDELERPAKRLAMFGKP